MTSLEADVKRRIKNMKPGDVVIFINKDTPGDIQAYEKGKLTFWWLRDLSVKNWRQWLRKIPGKLNA